MQVPKRPIRKGNSDAEEARWLADLKTELTGACSQRATIETALHASEASLEASWKLLEAEESRSAGSRFRTVHKLRQLLEGLQNSFSPGDADSQNAIEVRAGQ